MVTNNNQIILPSKREVEVTTGSENAPVQRAKQTSGWENGRPNFELINCLSSPDFFLNAVERMVSSHCYLKAKSR